MTARTFSTLNPRAIGDGLILDEGNLIVTTDRLGLSGSRAVFGTIPKATGHNRFDTYFYSLSRSDLTGLGSVGLAVITADVAQYIGETTDSWGLRPFNGGIWHGGSKIVDGPVLDERVCITTYVNFTRTANPLLAWFVDGNFYASVDLPGGSNLVFYLPAVSVGVGTDQMAGDLSAFCNFGNRPFDSQPHAVNS